MKKPSAIFMVPMVIVIIGFAGCAAPTRQEVAIDEFPWPSSSGGGEALTGETSPTAAVSRLESYMSREAFETLFPRRFGSSGWQGISGRQASPEASLSYDNFKAAIWELSHLIYEIEMREGHSGPAMSRTFVTNKATGVRTLVFEGTHFNAPGSQNLPIVTQTVDFGSFLAKGSENDRRRELAAFLANIAHETTGGWDTAPGGRFAWGLFFNEEVAFAGATESPYLAPNDPHFPPVPGRSYHGRGPIQLSWNFNYGLASVILFGDKNILLNTPELVAQSGKVGFMTALWFWMTPQPPKPSCHDVILGNWTPTARDIAAGRTEPGFGMTIMVINGGLEGNLTDADGRIFSRIGHYRKFAEALGADISGEKLDTHGMTSAGW